MFALLLAYSTIHFEIAHGAEPDVLTPHRVASLRLVTSAAVAPDGSRVAYTLGVPRQANVDEDGEPWSELWVTDTRGATPRAFVTGKVNVSSVRWTPDSQQIAFLAKRADDKFKALYVIPVDGGEARKAVELSSDIGGFSLAPDGKRAAVVASEPDPDSKKKLQDYSLT